MQKVNFDNKKMMMDPDSWPCWPYLPVKRKNYSLKDKNLGLLTADGGKEEKTIYHVYLFALPKTLQEFLNSPTTVYPNIDELLADGWVVD